MTLDGQTVSLGSSAWSAALRMALLGVLSLGIWRAAFRATRDARQTTAAPATAAPATAVPPAAAPRSLGQSDINLPFQGPIGHVFGPPRGPAAALTSERLTVFSGRLWPRWLRPRRTIVREYRNAPFITSPTRVVEQMAELAGVDERELLYDLGCGDGRIVIAAARQTGCRGVGFDLDPQRVGEARLRAEAAGVADRVAIVQQDVFTVDLSQADAVAMYLLPWMIERLKPQLRAMRPGCRIVSHDFWIDCCRPTQVVEIPALGEDANHTIFVYETPLEIDPNLEPGQPPRRRGGEGAVMGRP